MALPVSSLSQICRSIADFVSQGLDATSHSIRVMIGNPADAAPKSTDTDHRVNLFFYRLEPAGFFPDTFPGEPWRLRLHCLITAFGVKEGTVSSGENDLRLLGEVVRLFHETPVLAAVDVDGEEVRLQAVFQPLSADDINHLWSTQGDVAYRTSIAYELALTPIVPKEKHIPSPLVGSFGYESRGTVAARRASFTGSVQSPPVGKTVVDTGELDWAPQICFVYDDVCAYTLAFEIGVDAPEDFEVPVWIAGQAGTTVTLAWERWSSDGGWADAGSTAGAAVDGSTLDPDNVSGAATVVAVLPTVEIGGEAVLVAGQALLYAVRSYTLEGETEARTARSNPLLVTLYEASP